jgi:hypothetical protein
MSRDTENQIIKSVRRATAAANKAADQMEMELVHFKSGNQDIEFNLDITGETMWATQQQMADLFGRDRTTINEHIKNILKDNELDENSVCGIFPHTAPDGKIYEVLHFNLDMILSVGYRVSSAKATRFRQWATRTLRAYLLDGFALNESRLRNDPRALRDLAAKVRALRADEQNIYRGVRDVFAFGSLDYDAQSRAAQSFFARLQDKFLCDYRSSSIRNNSGSR